MRFDDRLRCVWTLALALGGGCAHRAGGTVAESEDLNRTIHSLKAENVAYQKQIEELENRVFILSEKREARKTSGEQVAMAPALPPELPRVTLRPGDRRGEPAPTEADAPAPDEVEVEFVGDAAKQASHRPVLRLYGDETPVLLASRTEVPRGERPLTIVGEGAARPDKGGRVQVSTARDLYLRALDALRSGRHADALGDFRSFLKQHAASEYADNAQYWLAECYYDQKEYAAAIREFRRVVDKYPNGNKVPDALLKVAFSQVAMGDAGRGKQTLGELLRSYPRHEAAGRAEDRLRELAGGTSKRATHSPGSAEEVK